MKFVVGVKEVHTQYVTVEAETVEEAVKLVEDGKGEEASKTKYEYALPVDKWTVTVVDETK